MTPNNFSRFGTASFGIPAALLLLIFSEVRAATVSIPRGASVQAAVNAHPSGTTFRLAAGTYTGQTVVPLANDSFIGAGGVNSTTPTIFEGKSLNQPFIVSYGSISGVHLQNLVVQHYISPTNTDQTATEVRTGPNWILTNVCVNWSGIDGVDLYTGTQMNGGEVKNCGHRGIGVSGNNVIVNGVEIAYNNTAQTSQYDDAAGLKGGAVSGVVVELCSVHDNHAVDIWADVNCQGWYITNNCVRNNDIVGIQYEISHGGSIYNNLVTFNGGSGNGGGQILVSNSDTTNVYLNTVVAGTNQNAILLQSDGNRSDALTLQNDGLNRNNVTFTGSGGIYGLIVYYGTAHLGTGNYSNGNNFHLNIGTGSHDFFWGGFTTPQPVLLNFTTYQQSSGQDPGSTLGQY